MGGKKINIHITFDYELFFGDKPGTIEKCLLEPVSRLQQLAAKHQVLFVFFVDAGMLVALDKFTIPRAGGALRAGSVRRGAGARIIPPP